MRFWLLLLIAPAVFGQDPPGLKTFAAGALSCGAVMRGVNRIQTYCYSPGLANLPHNTINDVNSHIIVPMQWCVPPNPQPAGCKYAYFSAEFLLLFPPLSGIYYQIVASDPAGGIDLHVSGTLTAIYGTTGAACPPLPVPWSGHVLDANQVKVPALLWTRSGEVCGTWNDGTGEFSCPPRNMFQVCQGVLQPIVWAAP